MSPCRYCVAPKRKPGCHATCPEYTDWNTVELERKETIRKNKEKDLCPYVKKRRKRK